MKLQLSERTLNAYINAALNEELDELFGSRVRKQSQRMITGKGWGNQRRSQDNLWGTANTDISSTDADEEVPQTLVGMIRKMENGLCAMEELSGIEPQEAPGALANGVAQYRSGGGFKMKDSLLAAINALSRIADRVSAVEKVSGSNAIMESISEGNDYVGFDPESEMPWLYKNTPARGTVATAGNTSGNVAKAAENAAGNVQNVAQTAANAGARTAAEVQSDLNKVQSAKAQMQALHTRIDRMGNPANREKLTQVADQIRDLSKQEAALTRELKTASNVQNVAQTAAETSNVGTRAAQTGAEAASAGKNVGFWGSRLNNMKSGMKTAGQGLKMMAHPGSAARAINAGTKLSNVGKVGAFARGGATALKGLAQASQWPLLLLSIADEAARQGAQARQRKIVRTYNCASVLAKRMANIAQEIADASGEPTAEEPLMEINVRRSRKSFDSIEQGMNQLSALMKQINTKVKTVQKGTSSDMPASLNTPEEIKQFQEWANDNGYADQTGQPLVPDGKFGHKTEYVYDQIASKLKTISESKIVIKEGQDILSALTDLENKVGVTGSGGRAYSDISRMSGGVNGSRMQGARAAKFIIRTYPPVLNQYLQVLSLAGANVRGIQPLRTDTRPNRDYDVREIQAIDQRIQQLLNIAQSVKDVKPSSKNVKLPPKPVHKPVSSPSKPKKPVENTGNTASDENTGTTITRETTPLDISGSNNITGKAETDSGNKLAGERPGLTYPQSAIRTMAQTAQSTMPLKDRRALNNRTTQNAIDGLNTMRDNGASRNQIRNDKRAVRDARRIINRGQPVSEQQLKDMVKEILKETLNK